MRPAQIIVPDRLQGGARMDVLTTPADQGVLAFDTVRTLPEDQRAAATPGGIAMRSCSKTARSRSPWIPWSTTPDLQWRRSGTA